MKFTKFTYLFLNSYFLSILLSLLIFLLLPPILPKYSIKTIYTRNKKPISGTDYYFHHKKQEISYKVGAYYNIIGRPSLVVYNDKGKVINQIELTGNFLNYGDRLAFGDFDSDGTVELYAFTKLNDSLRLHIIPNYCERSTTYTSINVCKIQSLDDSEDYYLVSKGFMDLDGDGYKELVFYITGGYSLSPRQVFSYNQKKNTLSKSPSSQAYIQDIIIYNRNSPGKQEFLLSTSAPDNFPGNEKPEFPDNVAWLMVMDSELNFIFPPREMGGYTSFFHTKPFIKNREKFIVSLFVSGGNSTHHNTLFLLDSPGNILLEKEFPEYSDQAYKILTTEGPNSRLFLVLKSGSLVEYDKNLSPVQIMLKNKVSPSHHIVADLNQDGHMEYIFFTTNRQEIWVSDENLTNWTNTNIPNEAVRGIPNIIPYTDEAGEPAFQLSLHYDQFGMKYIYNSWYFIKFLIYPGVFGVLLLFLKMLEKQQKTILKQKFDSEQKLTKLQIQAVKNQIDPHFTFNVINSLGAIIYNEDKKKAYEYLTQFSSLIRSSLEDSDRFSRSLSEELSLAKKYLELQTYRFRDRIKYIIEIENSVDKSLQVPRMVLQIHIENAIKHGLLPKKTGGEIKIKIWQTESHLILEIEDNGIGRKESSGMDKQSTQKGLSIMAQYYEIFNKFNKSKINQEIVDLYNHTGNTAGTRVIVKVPMGLKTS